MKALVFNPLRGSIELVDEAAALTFLRRRGFGFEVLNSRTDERLVVESSYTNLSRALTYAAYQAGIGVVIVPTTPPVVNWQSVPTIASGGGDYLLAPGYYLNDDPSQPLISLTGKNRRIVVQGQPGQPMVLRSRGDLFAGYNARLLIQNATLQGANPGVAGQCTGRAIRSDDFIRIELYNCLLDGTSGISLGTSSGNPASTVWQGSAANGDGLFIERNRVRNIRGQYSDGTSDSSDPMRIIPIKSNWGSTHSDSQRWNPSVAPADQTTANKSDPSKFGVRGWESAQFVQLRHQNGVPGRISDNEIVNEFGLSRCEDNINFYIGSGGTAAQPFQVYRNYIKGSQGLDWNYVPGSGVAYDGSNKVTLNALGYQNVNATGYSGSAHIMDGYDASTLNGVWERTGYVDFFDTVILENIATVQGGHDVRLRRIKLYELSQTEAGDPLAYHHRNFQMSNYGGSVTAKDASGTARPLWGNNEVSSCERYTDTTVGGLIMSSADKAATTSNGGLYDDATNLKYAALTGDFETQLLNDWRSARAAEGKTIGLTG